MESESHSELPSSAAELSRLNPARSFPALHRLDEAGWLSSTWENLKTIAAPKYYRLTKAGQRQLKTASADWQRISLAITNALQEV
jgi:PadR family transcriptional regulator